MAGSANITINLSDFRATLRKYAEYSKRTQAQITNTKAFFVARGAARETRKADPGQIAMEMETVISAERRTGKQKSGMGPRAAILVNNRLGPGAGLYGSEMAEAVRKLKASRKRSRAFLASGWIPAIKRLEPLADVRGAPRTDRSIRQYGRAKGRAMPAREAWRCVAEIINSAGGKESGLAVREEGLSKAFAAELASMKS